jgi:hypothetical protein
MHTCLTDAESAPTSPAEGQNLAAAIAGEDRDLMSPFSANRARCMGLIHILISSARWVITIPRFQFGSGFTRSGIIVV